MPLLGHKLLFRRQSGRRDPWVAYVIKVVPLLRLEASLLFVTLSYTKSTPYELTRDSSDKLCQDGGEVLRTASAMTPFDNS